MHEHLSLSEFIRQILGAELSETQKRILDYLQSGERAESVRALFGQLKLREADELNTWVRDYEAYVIRHQGEWTDSYRQMRDSLAEYSQEKVDEALARRQDMRRTLVARNAHSGRLVNFSSLYAPLTPEQLIEKYGPNYYPDMSPDDMEERIKRYKDQFIGQPAIFSDEEIRQMAAGYAERIKNSGQPPVIIDSLGGLPEDPKEPWTVHLTKQPRGIDLPKSNFVLNLLSQMPEQDRRRFLQRSAEHDEYWIDLESEIPNEEWVRHLPAGVTLTGEAAAKLLRSKMERTEKIRQSSLYGTFGVPKGKLAIIDSNFNRGQLFPRMRRSLRSEIREHFGMVQYRFSRSNYRQTGKTAAVQAFFDYNIGMLVRDQFVAVTPVSAVGSLDFFREFWAPRGRGYVLQAKHETGTRKAKKGYKK